jgi:hypothetical protein
MDFCGASGAFGEGGEAAGWLGGLAGAETEGFDVATAGQGADAGDDFGAVMEELVADASDLVGQTQFLSVE